MLLSIDCGIKNLAMCLIDPKTKKIHQWDVSGIPPQHADGIYPCFKRHLAERPWVLTADTVLIEKQPDRNRGMKSVENFLHAYFVINGERDVIIYDARHKIPDIAGAGRARYTQRKNASIERARKFLQDTSLNSNWIEHFDKHKKKDDLADTVMQALSFINRAPPKETKEDSVKVSKPRKPTENQVRTKYSKANLAWIVKTGAKQDARFKKDLGRYYRSIEELKSEYNI